MSSVVTTALSSGIHSLLQWAECREPHQCHTPVGAGRWWRLGLWRGEWRMSTGEDTADSEDTGPSELIVTE